MLAPIELTPINTHFLNVIKEATKMLATHLEENQKNREGAKYLALVGVQIKYINEN